MIKFIYENKEDCKKYIKYWFFIRILLLLLMLFVYNNYVKPLNTGFFDYCIKLYDNEYYYKISNSGYYTDNILVFYPLIPIIIRLIGVYGCIVLNNISSLIISFLLYYYSKTIVGLDNSYLIGVLFIFSPIQIYSFTMYTEFLLILFGLFGLIFYKEHRNCILTGLFFGLCLNCRLFGLIFIFSISLEFILKILYKKVFDIIYFVKVLLVSLSIGCVYPLYVVYRTSNLFGLLNLEEKYWLRIKTNVISFLPRTFFILLNSTAKYIKLYWFDFCLVAFLFLLIIFMIIYNRKLFNTNSIDFSYFIFSFLLSCSTIIVYTNVSPLGGVLRYFYSSYAFYIFLVRTFKNYFKKYRFTLFVLNICTIIIIGYYFYRGIYFF